MPSFADATERYSTIGYRLIESNVLHVHFKIISYIITLDFKIFNLKMKIKAKIKPIKYVVNTF